MDEGPGLWVKIEICLLLAACPQTYKTPVSLPLLNLEICAKHSQGLHVAIGRIKEGNNSIYLSGWWEDNKCKMHSV